MRRHKSALAERRALARPCFHKFTLTKLSEAMVAQPWLTHFTTLKIANSSALGTVWMAPGRLKDAAKPIYYMLFTITLHHNYMVQLYDFMRSLIFHWVYYHGLMVQHMLCMTFLMVLPLLFDGPYWLQMAPERPKLCHMGADRVIFHT